MRILFVANDYTRWKNGGSVVTIRNLEFLKNLDGVTVTEVFLSDNSKYNILKNIIFSESYGSNRKILKKYLNYLEHTDVVWFDGSLYGQWIELAKGKGVFTICFYHNIESVYYKARFDSNPSLINRMLLKYARVSERKSSQSSDCNILLNERDATNLKSIYGIAPQYLLPTTFSPISKEEYYKRLNNQEPYILFVGSNFFANVEGIMWFLKNVADKIHINIMIVGSICDTLKNLKLSKNIIKIGVVDNLTSYYANASAVISPIFSGSGTKTKTIEALRYGKTIIGTKEAFVGVPPNSKSCIICDSADDFITEINKLEMSKDINRDSLSIFETNFSENKIKTDFKCFWENHIQTKFR